MYLEARGNSNLVEHPSSDKEYSNVERKSSEDGNLMEEEKYDGMIKNG